MAAYDPHPKGCPFCQDALSLAKCDELLFTGKPIKPNWGPLPIR